MLGRLIFSLIVVATPCLGNENSEAFFRCVNRLRFDSAKLVAAAEPDKLLRTEMTQLAELLYYEGQADRAVFKIYDTEVLDGEEGYLTVFRLLNAGYFSLFYDKVKGAAFRNFYHAY